MLVSKIKILLQLGTFLIFSYSFTQNNCLSIKSKPEKELSYGGDYHLYQNDSLIYSKCDNNIITLFHLKKGKYLLKYDTIFGIDSITFNFESDHDFKEIILETEKISKEKLAQTPSYIESLKNNERIILYYSLGACYISKKKEVTILKENDQYYFVYYGRKKFIDQRRIARIIRHEKILKNLSSKTIHGGEFYSTCSEFFSLTKNGIQVYGKNTYCNTWSEATDIKRWMK